MPDRRRRWPYFTPAGEVRAEIEAARAALAPGATLIAGFQLFHPELADVGDLIARAAAAAPQVDELNFYNFGLVPRARLDWMCRAIAVVEGAA